MDLEAYREKMILIGRIRVKRNRWRVEAMIPGDVDTLAIKGHPTFNMSTNSKVEVPKILLIHDGETRKKVQTPKTPHSTITRSRKK